MGHWIETHRGVVKAWECDSFGHFTVAYYFDRFADASASLRDRLAGEPALPQGGTSTEFLARFVSELRAGEALHIESGVIEATANVLRLGHKMINSATGKLATTVEERVQIAAGAWPLEKGQPAILGAHGVEWESPEDDPGFADEAAAGFIDSARDRVRRGEVDETGQLALANYVHRSSAGCIQLLTAMGLTPDYLREARRGFSTFEIRLRLESTGPEVGDAVSVQSGLAHLGSSSVRMVHRMFDARARRRVATLRQSGVHFDLEARRSTPIPDEIRRRAAALVVAAGR